MGASSDRDPDEGAAADAAAAATFGRILTEAHLLASHELPDLVRRHVSAFGGLDAVCYLADLQQTVLIPFVGPGGPDIGQQLEPLPVATTLAGRAYQQLEILAQHREGSGTTVWLPLLDGSERLGVLAVSVDVTDDSPQAGPRADRLRRFASLMAELIMTKSMYGDTIVRLRRQARMGLAAELQWSLLPPLTFACREVTVAAVLEPAYEVAGDTVDYAVDAGVAKVAVFDGMGHGLRSTQLAALSVAGYRNARRSGRSLTETCLEIDDTLIAAFGGTMFTTAVLAELDTQLGALRWVNAGHPEPLLLRRGRLIKSLHVPPRPPLGIDLHGARASATPSVGSEDLEPGDCVLLYTDGVTEARSPTGEFFGEQRLTDLVIRNLASGLPAPETMRRVVQAVLEHQQGRLTDDASLALIQWPSNPDALLPYRA
jgi:serine/threonine protein phosphatase PrpC